MNRKKSACIGDRNERLRAGRLLGLVGCLEGLAAIVWVLKTQLDAFLPGVQFSLGVILHEDGFLFLVGMIALFALTALLVLLSSIHWFTQWIGLVLIAAGSVLVVLSLLTVATVGGFTIFGAVPVVFSGMLIHSARYKASES